jgi:Fic family protein
MTSENDDRHSVADIPQIISDPDQVKKLEVINGFRQFDLARDIIKDFTRNDSSDGRGKRKFRLRPSLVLQLQGIAVANLTSYAGVFRPGSVKIGKSAHQPPDAVAVPGLVEEMCDEINDHFETTTLLRLAAYTLWRLNWIHPFVDGNGRTSRILSHIVLNIRLGYMVPGTPTMPELIAQNKSPYYNALEIADKSHASGAVRFETIDLSAVEQLIGGHFGSQLLSVAHQAGIKLDR